MQWKSKNLLTNLPAAKYSLLQIGQEDSNGSPAIYFDGNALFRSCIHSRSAADQQVNGVLIGEVMQWQEAVFLDIRQVREKKEETDWLLFLQEIRAELTEEQEILGWYHSQPEEDIFLSEQVSEIHQLYFAEPKQFLLLLDPVLRRFGIFQRKNDYLCLIPGFKVTSSPERGEQTRQLLYQIDFSYANYQAKPKTTVMKIGDARKVIKAYQPPDFSELLKQEKAEELEPDRLLQELDGYREVFFSKDILVKKQIRNKTAIQKIVDKLLAEIASVTTKAVIKLYWELAPNSNDYFEELWICQIRWNGKTKKHSVVWNEEELL